VPYFAKKRLVHPVSGCLLLELGADGDSFFCGAEKEVFAVEGDCVLAPGFAQGAEVVDAIGHTPPSGCF